MSLTKKVCNEMNSLGVNDNQVIIWQNKFIENIV